MSSQCLLQTMCMQKMTVIVCRMTEPLNAFEISYLCETANGQPFLDRLWTILALRTSHSFHVTVTSVSTSTYLQIVSFMLLKSDGQWAMFPYNTSRLYLTSFLKDSEQAVSKSMNFTFCFRWLICCDHSHGGEVAHLRHFPKSNPSFVLAKEFLTYYDPTQWHRVNDKSVTFPKE